MEISTVSRASHRVSSKCSFGYGRLVAIDPLLVSGAERPRDEPPGQPRLVSRRTQHAAGRVGSIELLGSPMRPIMANRPLDQES